MEALRQVKQVKDVTEHIWSPSNYYAGCVGYTLSYPGMAASETHELTKPPMVDVPIHTLRRDIKPMPHFRAGGSLQPHHLPPCI